MSELAAIDRLVLRARGGVGTVPTDRRDLAYRTARPLSSRVVRHNDIGEVNAQWEPEANRHTEALRWRREHLSGRTMSRSERRDYGRKDRRTRGISIVAPSV